MPEGNVGFSRDPGYSALQNCFKYAQQAGREACGCRGGLGELFRCFHVLLRAGVPGTPDTYFVNASGKGILGIINQHRSGFLLHWSCSILSFGAAHFVFNF